MSLTIGGMPPKPTPLLFVCISKLCALKTILVFRNNFSYYWRFHETAAALHLAGERTSASRVLNVLRRHDGAVMRDPEYGMTDHRAPLYARLYNEITGSRFFSIRGDAWAPANIPALAGEVIQWRADHAHDKASH